MAAPAFTANSAFGDYTSAGSGSSSTVTSTYTATAGRAQLLLISGQNTASDTTITVADSKGNTGWVRIGTQQFANMYSGNDVCIDAWVNPSITTGGSGYGVTISSANLFCTGLLVELDQAVALDQSANGIDSDGAAPWQAPSITTGAPDCIVVAALVPAATTGYTLTATGYTGLRVEGAGWYVAAMNKRISGSGATEAPAINCPVGEDSGYGNVPLKTFSLKAVGGSPDVTVALTGAEGTGAAGTLGLAVDLGVSGNAGAGAAGTVGVSLDKALTNNVGTGAAGTLAPALSLGITGAAGTGDVGTMSVSAGSDVTVGLSGVEGTGQAGTVVASVSGQPVTVALSGVGALGEVGTITFGEPPAGPVNENDIGGGVGSGGTGKRRQVYWRPLLQRMLDAKAEDRPAPPKGRAKVRAKAIEQDAAALVLSGDASVAEFNRLMDRWAAQFEIEALPVDTLGAFAAALRMRAEQAGQAERLREMLAAARRQQDDDEAAILLLLT